MIWRIAICLILGYAFGCISTGFIVGKIQKVDIRNYGSGNVGTTNALRTLGKKAALITLLGDVFKCAIPVVLIKFVFFKELPEADLFGLYTALGAVLGHTFPFYLKFKGGKGIAVLVGTILTFDWRIFLIWGATFFIILAITRFVSLLCNFAAESGSFSSFLLLFEVFYTYCGFRRNTAGITGEHPRIC